MYAPIQPGTATGSSGHPGVDNPETDMERKVMKYLKSGLFITLTLLSLQSFGYGFQGAGGEEGKKASDPVKEPNRPKGPGVKKPTALSTRPGSTNGSSPVPVTSALAEVIINTGLGDCLILLDGET